MPDSGEAPTQPIYVAAPIWRSGDYDKAVRHLVADWLWAMPRAYLPPEAIDLAAAADVIFFVLHAGFERCVAEAGLPEPRVQFEKALNGFDAAGAVEFRNLVLEMLDALRSVYSIRQSQIPQTDFEALYRYDRERYARFLDTLAPLHVRAYELDHRQSLRAPLWEYAGSWPYLKIVGEREFAEKHQEMGRG